MESRIRLIGQATLIGLLLTLLVIGAAYATTIVVDGDDDPWPPLSLQITDPNEDGDPEGEDDITDNFDLEDIFLRCFSVNVFPFPPGTAGIQAVSTPGGAVIICYQTAGIQTVNREPSVQAKN